MPGKRFVVIGLCCASLCVASEYVENASDFATSVESYVAGVGATYSVPASALGRPTVDTRGDGSTGSPFESVVVLPINPAFLEGEVVTVGEGGHLILKFDHPVLDDPLNPCGIDLIVFGNVLHNLGGGQFWTNGDPNLFTIQSTNMTLEPGVTAVSQDGSTWYTFDNTSHVPPKPTPFADIGMSTLGRIYDPANPDPSLNNNLWWGAATDPTLPVNPDWTGADFVGLTVAEYAHRYGCAAGGTGFDLKDVGLTWIQYVRITNDDGDDLTPEVDAVSDVKPWLFPDFDCDHDVDLDDVDHFVSCATGPKVSVASGDCQRADLDQDNDVDQVDFAVLQRCFSGENVAYFKECMNP